MLLWEKIFSIINEKGMTQKEFSKATGIAESTISDWKHKKINPGVDKIPALCTALEISVEDLLGISSSRSRSFEEDYIVEGYEFVGWYIDDVLVSKNYKYSFKMPNKNTKVTPMFSELETFSYVLGSKTDLNTNIEKTSKGYLVGSDIASYYNHTSNKLVIKYNGLEKLKPGLHSFIYESRLIINVFIKINDKDITQISVDYDTNYPNATLSFNEDPNYDYYYSLDGDEYKKCYDGMSFDIANKFTGHQLDIKCEDGSPVTYTIEALPTQAFTFAVAKK